MKYVCEICGYIYDETAEGTPWNNLDDTWSCPLCTAPKACFKPDKTEESDKQITNTNKNTSTLSIQKNAKKEDILESNLSLIHEMSVHGSSRIEAMRTRKPVPGWDDILLLGGQLSNPPLADKADVDTTTIIGKHARKPMVLEHAVYVSHMSFGALSKEAKTALSMGTAAVHTAQCSGEGGILPDEINHAYKYIFEYVPNKYSVTDENLKRSDAIEIKIGQGWSPSCRKSH